MPQVWLGPVDRLVTGIAEVAFGHDPKRTDSCERATVVAIQFVPVLAIEHDFAFKPARQLEAVDKRVSRIDISFARVTIANVLVAVAHVVLFAIEARLIAHLNPRHLHVANVLAAISISGVKVHHTTPSSKKLAIGALVAVMMYERLRSTKVGLDAVHANGQADVQAWSKRIRRSGL